MPDINDKVGVEAFTVAGLYINEMQSEVKSLVQRCQGLETFQADCNKKICEYQRKLSDCRLLVSQHEVRILTLTESLEEAEARKRSLEEDVDSLRKECENLNAAGQAQAVINKEKAEKEETATTLDEQMNQLRNIFQKQVATLRGTISEKHETINELEEQMNQLRGIHQHQIVTLIKKISKKKEMINELKDQN